MFAEMSMKFETGVISVEIRDIIVSNSFNQIFLGISPLYSMKFSPSIKALRQHLPCHTAHVHSRRVPLEMQSVLSSAE